MPSEAKKSDEPMKQAIEIMEQKQEERDKKDDKGCFSLPGLQRSELFICVNMRTLDPLFLFHYAWKTRKLNEVVNVTYQGTWPATMKFSDSHSEKIPSYLKPNFSWLQKSWKNTEFTPKHCKITKKDSESIYVLTCSNPSKLETKPHWEQNIPSSHITIHKNSFDLKNNV